MEIILTKNYSEMSKVAAVLVERQIERKRSSVLGLATGHTPEKFYHELIKAYKAGRITFKRAKTFNLDEYVGLDQTDPKSYHSYMRKKLFNRIDLPRKKEFILDGKAKDLDKECRLFEKKISQAGGIDLQILGIGLDGHIGFDEPGSKINSKTRVVKLVPSTRRANSKYFGGIAKTPHRALTMGIGTILKAKKIILLADGKEKAGVVARALQGPIGSAVPASFLQKHKQLIVILDHVAASKLK